MPPKDDAERFRRIRDKQIAARDPMVKVRKLDHTVSQKHRRARQSFSVLRMWLDIPKMWRGTMLGGVVGVVILAVVLAARHTPARQWLALAALLLGLGTAYVLLRPTPASSDAARRLESSIGAGTPVLLELQSPY